MKHILQLLSKNPKLLPEDKKLTLLEQRLLASHIRITTTIKGNFSVKTS